MADDAQSRHRNLLLRGMDAGDYALLAPDLEPFAAERHLIFCRPGHAAEHAIFLDDGCGSIVAQSPEGLRVEAGLFGYEGFGPVVLAIGDDRSPYEGTIQVPGAGHRIAAAAFQSAMERSATLRLRMQRFAHVFSIQAGYTALSNAVHPIEERLARWILMCDDRVASGELALTHEFLSVMLAVRRPSVTTALHVLEGSGFIHATRGMVTVRNRVGLEEFAGDAYGRPEAEYARLLGAVTGDSPGGA